MFCFLSTHSPTPTKSYVRTWTPEPFIFATIVHGTQQGRNQITIHISRFNLEDHKLASSLSFFFLPFLLCQPFHLHFSLTFPLLLSHTGHQKSPRKRSYVYIVHIHVYRVTNLINEKRSHSFLNCLSNVTRVLAREPTGLLGWGSNRHHSEWQVNPFGPTPFSAIRGPPSLVSESKVWNSNIKSHTVKLTSHCYIRLEYLP